MARRARANFTDWAEIALAPLQQVPAAHHRLLIAKLEAVARGEIQRLMVFMPPGSAKSTYASVLFPAWFLAQGPNRSIIAASHTADLADAFSRRVQAMVREHRDLLGYAMNNEAATLWMTDNGGQYKAAGVGGPITGFRADVAIIDDPVKSRADAESPTYRDRAYAWFQADLVTRLKPGAPVVVIQTRWHMDDLSGRLLQDNAEGWDVLNLPAMAGDNDALGRAPGQPLWADDPKYPYGAELLRIQREAGERDWWSLYQQSPRTLTGSIFKVAMIPTHDAAPAGLRPVRAWDLAATAATGTRDPDWTVGLLLARTEQGAFVVLDVVRLRGGPDEVEAAIMATASRDGRRVPVLLPQDPGQAGKVQVAYLTRRLAGYTVRTGTESGDKATRAMGIASQCNVGNLSIVRAPWNRAFLDELATFPGGHDDAVDALSRAFADVADTSAIERFRAMAS